MAFFAIHPKEISAILREKRGVLIDVRERGEYRLDHYRNAVNCPYDEIESGIRCMPKNRPLVLYCEYGSTSLLAARLLGKEGYEVYTVIGGMHAIYDYEAKQRNPVWVDRKK